MIDLLAGIRILDLTAYVPGPFASKVLADFGACVIHIEPPQGDPARSVPHRLGADGALHAWLNGDKQCRHLDLKSDADRAAFFDLVREADVVIEGFTPGVAQRLGVDEPRCRALRPDLVYCSISGEGQTSRFAATPGHDINFAARAGLVDQIRTTSGEVTVAPLLADTTGALFAAAAISSALVDRERTRRGAFIDVSLLGSALALAGTQIIKHSTGMPPSTESDLNLGADPAYRVYRTADDRLISIGALEPKFWSRLCALLDRRDLIAMRAEDPVQVARILSEVFASQPRAHWDALFDDADICYAPVNDLAELATDSHILAGGLVSDAGDGAWWPELPVRVVRAGATS